MPLFLFLIRFNNFKLLFDDSLCDFRSNKYVLIIFNNIFFRYLSLNIFLLLIFI